MADLEKQLEAILAKLEALEPILNRIHGNLKEMTNSITEYNSGDVDEQAK